MSLVLNWIYDHQWAITEDYLDTIIKIACRESDIQKAIEARDGRPLEKTAAVTIRDNGIAVITINGPIFPRANLFTMFSGATSIELLAKDFTAALENPLVKGIVLNIDSPGGDIIGTSEFANMLFAARERKPIDAYGYGSVASGAYWIGSSARKLYLADTATAGSIGVVSAWTSRKKRDEASGIVTHEIVSSVSPKKRVDPTTDDGRAEIQRVVDDLASVFVAAISRNRDTDEKTVIEKFGQGGVHVGQVAVSAGMADGISSLEAIIESMANEGNKTFYTKGGPMDLSELKAKHPAVYQAAVDEGVVSGKAAGIEEGKKLGHTDGLAEGKTVGANEERSRIQGIASLKVPGAEKVIAENMFKAGVTKADVAILACDEIGKKASTAAAAVTADATALATQSAAAATGAPAPTGKNEGDFEARAEKIGKERRESAKR
jgi:ClpP class serine protease